jgi:hypothetical protein
MIDHRQPVAEFFRFIHEMGNEDNSGALLAHYPDQVPGDVPAAGSSPVVISSRKMTRGLFTSARAMNNRCL